MKIQELLDKEEKWTQGSLARDEKDCMCMANDSEAIKWCLSGAILKCYEVPEGNEVRGKILNYLMNELNYEKRSILIFNDSNDFSAVKNLIQKIDI